MNYGKGTDDFESYVRNLQLAVETTSVGTQLSGGNGEARIRRTMIYNPYGATVAQIGIFRYRTASGNGPKR